jgi:hypothetical protein
MGQLAPSGPGWRQSLLAACPNTVLAGQNLVESLKAAHFTMVWTMGSDALSPHTIIDRGTDHLSGSGIKWMSGSAKRQSNNATLWLCTTTHPFYTRFTSMFGTSIIF